jgi:hypothetical protein
MAESLGVFMIPKNGQKLEELAEQYFVNELGLDPEDVPEAARNLLGAFEILFKIDQRINKQTVCSTASQSK